MTGHRCKPAVEIEREEELKSWERESSTRAGVGRQRLVCRRIEECPRTLAYREGERETERERENDKGGGQEERLKEMRQRERYEWGLCSI